MNRAEKRRQQKLAKKAAGKKASSPSAAVPPKQATVNIGQLLNNAVQLHSSGRLNEAETLYRQILHGDPSNLDAQHLLGVVLFQSGEPEQALDCIAKAINLNPNFDQAHNSMGNVLKEMGRNDEAIASFEKALNVNQNLVEAHYNLANTFRDIDRHDEAIVSYRKAIAIKPDYADALFNLAHVLKDKGDLNEMRDCFQQVIKIDPTYTEAHFNLGVVHEKSGRLEEALACFHRTIELKPDHADAHFGLAGIYLAIGELKLGWQEYEWRWRQEAAAGIPRYFPQPRWNDENLEGKSILLWGEQGIGDEIRNASLIPDIVALGAHCSIECEPRLVDLYSRSFPGTKVHAYPFREAESGDLPFDFQIPMGSLPGFFRKSLADFPDRQSYLVVDDEKQKLWRERLSALGSGPKIGVSWRSHLVTKVRELTFATVANLEPLLDIKDAVFVNLQYDECAEEIAEFEERFGVTLHAWNDIDLKNDIDGAMALTSGLDVVVTLMSTVYEMGGSLGIPTFVFHPPGSCSFSLGTKGVPFHPSVRMYLNSPGESWEHVISKIANDVGNLISPASIEQNYAAAVEHHKNGQLDEAAAIYQKILDLDHTHISALQNLGTIALQTGKNEEALDLLKKVVVLKPDHAGAFSNIGTTQKNLGQFEEAIVSFKKALELDPTMLQALNNLAVTYKEMGNQVEAESCFLKSISHRPDHANTHYNLGNFYKDVGRLDEAISSYASAIDKNPSYHEAHNNLLMTMHYAPNTTGKDLFDAATAWASPYNAVIQDRQFRNIADPERRLKIGYVSADFFDHPVGFYLRRILPFHNEKTVDFICYSNTTNSDDTTARLRQNASIWRNVTNFSDEALAEQILDDQIDILVDLSGHTAGNRLLLFALRPAPIQVTWMGYTGTTGLKSIDYIIADKLIIPEDEQTFFSENVFYLPGCYLCFDPPDLDIASTEPPAKKAGHITFGSFNNRLKITAETISGWAGILNAVPNSRLLLKTPLFNAAAERQSILDKFSACDIDPSRLELEGGSPRLELLKAYQRVDIILDTQPFGGGVTTGEALWMGVPVISHSHPRWSGRLGKTVLTSVGLQDFVAESPQQYHDLAVNLANDLPRLEKLHAELRTRMVDSPFCDGNAFSQKLEQAYRKMWQIWCETRESK